MVATKLYGGGLSGFDYSASQVIDGDGECMVAIAVTQCTMRMPHRRPTGPLIVGSSSPPEIARRGTDLVAIKESILHDGRLA